MVAERDTQQARARLKSERATAVFIAVKATSDRAHPDLLPPLAGEDMHPS